MSNSIGRLRCAVDTSKRYGVSSMETAHLVLFCAEGALVVAFGAALVYKHWADVLKEQRGASSNEKPPEKPGG